MHHPVRPILAALAAASLCATAPSWSAAQDNTAGSTQPADPAADPAAGPAAGDAAAVAGDPTSAAQALAAAWCAAVASLDEGAATTLMSPDLQQDVALARIANDAFAAGHPGEKPPLGDGLPLTAFADKVDDCTASDVTPSGALLTFTASGGGATTWTDAIEFVSTPDGGLRVGDVLYAPERVVRMSDALAALAETGE